MLRELVARSGTTIWAEFALLIFFVAFVAICVRVWRSSQQTMDRHARIPLEDEPVEPRTGPGGEPRQEGVATHG
ncbi:MAG: cbb3-type cytochrome c oxidase subunit 3 [Planctomycetota bacterium]|nr:MAG: cbb3-type cytochrome c oxidase subunit 3 [Planctomycetota bacterium]